MFGSALSSNIMSLPHVGREVSIKTTETITISLLIWKQVHVQYEPHLHSFQPGQGAGPNDDSRISMGKSECYLKLFRIMEH